MKQVLWVFIGGGVGSVARYLISKALNNQENGFPYGTFAVNIFGSLLIGLILGYLLKNTSMSYKISLFLVTGFCGGFTTFSTFAYENHLFLKTGNLILFFTYTLASFIIGFSAVFFGMWIMK